MPTVLISGIQDLVRDSYASAPTLDLVMRSNGEEKVSIIDNSGFVHAAGFDAPTVAPTFTTPVATVYFPDETAYWKYVYVYVSKRYIYVENAVTGGGSDDPRSNPSPVSAITNSTAGSATTRRARLLSMPTTIDSAITHIWIYRTARALSSDLADVAADAGILFWIGEVANDPNSPFVFFNDEYSEGEGIEQLETDNFTAPQFQNCVFFDPYFWGFGNSPLRCEVTVTTTGGIAIVATVDRNYANQWFNGRDGQVVTLAGIFSGGFDNKGSFYFKQIDLYSGQLYDDATLTNMSNLPAFGQTFAEIKGPQTTLYRSKPRNPFSWGFTEVIGTVNVPTPWFFRVSGGRGTALAVLPNQSLLKLDVEEPARCYVLNLRNQDREQFTSSLRTVSENVSVSCNGAQFPGVLTVNNYMMGIDIKNFSIFLCDGSSQVAISSPVYETLRRMKCVGYDVNLLHGVYIPRGELNCFFLRVSGSPIGITQAILYHAQTQQWSLLNLFDITASALVFDSKRNESVAIVASETGLIGEMFHPEWYHNWTPLDPPYSLGEDISVTSLGVNAGYLVDPENTFDPLDVGNIGCWVLVIAGDGDSTTDPAVTYRRERYYCRISNCFDNTLEFDRILDYNFQPTEFSAYATTFERFMRYYVGVIEAELGKYFDVLPFSNKKVEEIGATLAKPISFENNSQLATVEIKFDYQPFTGNNEFALQRLQSREDVPYLTSTAWVESVSTTLKTRIPFDFMKNFGMIIRDRSYESLRFQNYAIKLSIDASNDTTLGESRQPS